MTVDMLVLGLAVVALAAAFALLVQERRQQQRMDEAAERLRALLDRIEASGKLTVKNRLCAPDDDRTRQQIAAAAAKAGGTLGRG